MARGKIGASSDSPSLYPAIQQANADLDDLLQQATGIDEGYGNVGGASGLPTFPTGAPGNSDTLLTVALKAYSAASGVIDADDVRHSGSPGAVDRNLGADYDYKSATIAVLGTTTISDSAEANTLGYPSDGMWHVCSTFSDGQGGTAGRVRTVYLSNGTGVWLTTYKDGAVTPSGDSWTTATNILGSPYSATVADDAAGWSLVGTEYRYVVLGATHQQGTDVTVDLYDESGGTTSVPYLAGVSIEDATGNVTISVSGSPVDARVDTRIIIRTNS